MIAYEYYKVKIQSDLSGQYDRYNYYVGIREKKSKMPIYLTDYHKFLYEKGRNVNRNSDNAIEIMNLVRFLNWMLTNAPDKYKELFVEQGPKAIDFKVCEIFLSYFGEGKVHGMRRVPASAYQRSQIEMLTRLLRSIYKKYRPTEYAEHWFKSTRRKGQYEEAAYELSIKWNNDQNESSLIRYLPPEVAALMLKNAYLYDRGIYLGLFFQFFGAFRSGEVCNVRSIRSKYGPGYTIERDERGIVTYMSINLMHEYILRSDLTPVGKIKKERRATIPSEWLEKRTELGMMLDWQENKLKKLGTEEYGPLFINKRKNKKTGKYMAMTKQDYVYRVKVLFEEYVLPEIYESNDDKIKLWADELLTKSWGLHWGRHLASIRFALLPGVTSNELMEFRGDTSEESALTYIRHAHVYRNLYETAITYTFNEVVNQACKTMRR